MTAADYAHALWSLKDASAAHASRVRGALRRRGHEPLLPSVFAEYQKLLLRAARIAAQKHVTPERERTRVLLELYKNLIR